MFVAHSPNISTSSRFVITFDASRGFDTVVGERETGRLKGVLLCVFPTAKSRPAPGIRTEGHLYDRLLNGTVSVWEEEAYSMTIRLHAYTYVRTNERSQKHGPTGPGVWHRIIIRKYWNIINVVLLCCGLSLAMTPISGGNTDIFILDSQVSYLRNA